MHCSWRTWSIGFYCIKKSTTNCPFESSLGLIMGLSTISRSLWQSGQRYENGFFLSSSSSPFFFSNLLFMCRFWQFTMKEKSRWFFLTFYAYFHYRHYSRLFFFRIDVHKNGRNHSVVLVSIKIRKL